MYIGRAHLEAHRNQKDRYNSEVVHQAGETERPDGNAEGKLYLTRADTSTKGMADHSYAEAAG